MLGMEGEDIDEGSVNQSVDVESGTPRAAPRSMTAFNV